MISGVSLALLPSLGLYSLQPNAVSRSFLVAYRAAAVTLEGTEPDLVWNSSKWLFGDRNSRRRRSGMSSMKASLPSKSLTLVYMIKIL